MDYQNDSVSSFVCVSVSSYACMFTCFEHISVNSHLHVCTCTCGMPEVDVGSPIQTLLSYLLRQDLSLAVRSGEQTNLSGQLTSGISAF